MISPLERLATPTGPLAAEPPDATEFAGLCASAKRSLADARRQDNALESRFLLAYTSAHAYCLAALRHKGYRARHRYIVFQSLPHTLELGPEVWKVLSKAHDQRNHAEYEGRLELSEQFVHDLIVACDKVASRVEALPALPREIPGTPY